MKITEHLIENLNSNRVVHMRLLKHLLKRVPSLEISNIPAKFYESIKLIATNSRYGGTVYSASLNSRETDNTKHTNQLKPNIDDQLAKFKELEVEPLQQQINSLKGQLNELSNEVHK